MWVLSQESCAAVGVVGTMYHARDPRENDVPMQTCYQAAKMKLLWRPKQDSIEDESTPLNGDFQVLVPVCSYIVGC